MSPPASSPAEQLGGLLFGYRVSQAVSVAAALGVADTLATGPRASEELAAELGCDPAAFYRLVRLLAASGVLEEDAERRFSLTPVGALLRSDVPGSMREPATLQGRPEIHAAYARLEDAVRRGENAFEIEFGENIWSWRARQPELASQFNRAMATWSRIVAPALAAAFDFGSVGTVVDIGGGSGSMIAGLLAEHPELRGIVFDQPAVVTEAEPVLQAAGVRDRAQLVGGDFFVDVPVADVYVMKSILHDWDDEECVRILRVIQARAGAEARLHVVERVLGGPNEDLQGKLSDIHMLVMPGGLERTLDEWRSLLHAGGWALQRREPLAAGWDLIEATRVGD
ncbi:MAG TPA: methyltransferase [Candidatus Limnocylindrales bacterium]|nr:methyltransferase [Candidatus Limnocylindrales bacterium]